jgi:catechol 2,3-dioxygenase-like lactoylglutathione lyase family enzyme
VNRELVDHTGRACSPSGSASSRRTGISKGEGMSFEPGRTAGPPPTFHHLGIQTADLDNAARWYQDFLGCRCAWSLTTFSELTTSRLPGITELREFVVGDVRIHLFQRPGAPAPAPEHSSTQFQHVCLAADSPRQLAELRERWLELYRSGRYHYALDVQPTEIVVDADGVQSVYVYDVNGLEFEFTYVPGAR